MTFEWLDESYRQLRDIEPAEVHEALRAEHRWPRLAVDDDLDFRVLTIWARSTAGRPLIVAARAVTGLRWQCLGARDMTTTEQADFEAWEGER